MFSILNVLQDICAKSRSFSELIAYLYWDTYSDKTLKKIDLPKYQGRLVNDTAGQHCYWMYLES